MKRDAVEREEEDEEGRPEGMDGVGERDKGLLPPFCFIFFRMYR